MRVLFVAPMPPPYGGITNWTRMIREYTNHRDDIEAEFLNISPKSVKVERSILNRIFAQGMAMIKLLKVFKKIIKHNSPDVIHMTTSGKLGLIRDYFFLKVANKSRRKVAYHIRFGRVPTIATSRTIEWRLMKINIRLSSTVIAIDRSTEKTLCEHIPFIDVMYIPNPFEYPITIGCDILNMVKLKSEYYAVFIGRVSKTKGIEELLTAWKEIHLDYPDWVLKIVGIYSQKYMDYLAKHFSLEGVVFEGEQPHDKAIEIIKMSDIFVLPSYTEGFPNAVLEAMAYGKPIIATKVGAIPEMIKDDCGILIAKKNPSEIVSAFKRLIDDPEYAQECGRNAVLKLKSQYHIDTVFQQYLEVWRNII